MKIFKKLAYALAAAMIFGSAPVAPIAAQTASPVPIRYETETETDPDTPDTPDVPETPVGETGSLTIVLTDPESNQSVEGGTLSKSGVGFELIKVADIVNGRYELIAPFKSEVASDDKTDEPADDNDSDNNGSENDAENDTEKAAEEKDPETEIDINDLQTALAMQEAAAKLQDKITEENSAQLTKYTAITNDEGKAVISGIPAGVYLLKAADMANYEIIMPTLLAFPTYSDASKDMMWDLTVEPKHEPFPILRIVKKDSQTGQPITSSNATFGIYSNAECTDKVAELTTSAGQADYLLKYGTYYVKEIVQPNGYELSNQVVQIIFNANGITVNGSPVTPDESGVITISIDDIKSPEPITPSTPSSPSSPTKPTGPNTSTNTGVVIAVLAALCAVIAAGILYWNRKKKAVK